MRALSLVLRLVAAACAIGLAAGAALVHEAAGVTQRSVERAAAALQGDTPEFAIAGLDSSLGELERSWARPLDWHAGAGEAKSWMLAQRAALTGEPPATVAASAQAAAASLARAPVQPGAWVRLAALVDAGAPGDVCDVRECLNRSWSAAQMADAPVACSRLRIAYENGFLRRDDVRIAWVAQSDYWGSVMRSCFAFMRPADMFRALMIAEQDRAAREARRGLR